MTMWTVVIPCEPQTAAAGGPCLDGDFLFDVPLSLSAGRKWKSVYFNYLAERLQPTTPPATPISSPFLPTSLCLGPASLQNRPIGGRLLSITASVPLHWREVTGWKSALVVTTSECWSWRYSPNFQMTGIFTFKKKKKGMKKNKNHGVILPTTNLLQES